MARTFSTERREAIGIRLAQELEPYKVKPPAHFQLRGKHAFFPRECYRRAVHYLMRFNNDDPYIQEIKLVHGCVSTHIHPIPHAWVELPGDIVFDGVLHWFYQKKGYYEVKHAVAEIKYDLRSMHGMICKHGDCGPWDGR